LKQEVDIINAIPSKRIYRSIIADYDLPKAICELIDNAVDQWVLNGKETSLVVGVDLNCDQQTIRVCDNACGVEKEKLPFIVGPGQTGNAPDEQVIGIFGVGTKRAVVALSQDIRITTRYKDQDTYRLEYDDGWLMSESWELPLYEVDPIEESTTIIDLHRLRFKVTEDSIIKLRNHVGETYAKYLDEENFTIIICDKIINPIRFDNWAYPPMFEPREYYGDIVTRDGDDVHVSVTAGLSLESSPIGEYGVYVYCNDRLIVKELKDYEVGFVSGVAGQPHPSISLMKIIISLEGEAQSMPWNSSKSGISYQHPVFSALQGWLLKIVKDWASLSRRLESHWQDEVFPYKEGKIKKQKIRDFPSARSSYLPSLPKTKLRYIDKIKQVNRIIAKDKPWVKGLYEGIIVYDIIDRKKLEQGNRIMLILLDSTIEIAFKEYLVYESGAYYSDDELHALFRSRKKLLNLMESSYGISKTDLNKVRYYHDIRNKLIHERASISISNENLNDYRDVVEKILH